MNMVANGAVSHKKELSWDDFAAGDFPSHQPTVDEQHLAYFRQAVTQAAATMDTPPYNDDKGKLTRAMGIVLSGKVRTHESSLYGVQGSKKVYRRQRQVSVSPGTVSASQRTRWCRHMVAVELLKRASEHMQPVNGNGSANGNGHHPVLGDGKVATPFPHETQVQHPASLPVIPDCNDSRHWTDHEPPVVWHLDFMLNGISHGVTVRCDDLQEAKAQVKEITALVKKAQADDAWCSYKSEA